MMLHILPTPALISTRHTTYMDRYWGGSALSSSPLGSREVSDAALNLQQIRDIEITVEGGVFVRYCCITLYFSTVTDFLDTVSLRLQ